MKVQKGHLEYVKYRIRRTISDSSSGAKWPSWFNLMPKRKRPQIGWQPFSGSYVTKQLQCTTSRRQALRIRLPFLCNNTEACMMDKNFYILLKTRHYAVHLNFLQKLSNTRWSSRLCLGTLWQERTSLFRLEHNF